MKRYQTVAAFLVGLLFALGLGISGMTQPHKVIGFLDLWNWDPSLMFVMIGAVGVHASLYPLIVKRKSPLFDVKWHLPARGDLDSKLIAGAAIFGTGWGLGGYCPGPALTSLMSGQINVAIFVASMAIGIRARSVVV